MIAGWVRDILGFLEGGGPVLIPIAAVSIVLWYLIADLAIAASVAHRTSAGARDSAFAGWRRGIRIVHALIAAAPLLGLLGTIHGLVAAFDVLALSGGAPARELSGGIAQALITTEAGLAVAVPALFAVRSIESRLRRIRERLDRVESRLARGAADAAGGAA
ncbi:MAG: MotA/TolQ/ExbB proton channel family protein [Planctomycetes bacterium]|nr:MotA/TolQ/ExbB proton channel family protein [Planctomycetota bacterium]